MAQTIDDENQFVVDLLTTLRNEKFSAPAWVHFLQRSWEMACATAAANPSLKRSWAHATLLIGMLALVVLLGGIVTDIFDGQIARRTKTQSKLGRIADGEADFCLYVAITLILIQNSILPYWVGVVMLLRFLLPLLATTGSYFLFARPVRFGSTTWGKYAGLSQCLYFLLLLAPDRLASFTKYFNTPLLTITLILLIAAPLTQLITNVPKGDYA